MKILSNIFLLFFFLLSNISFNYIKPKNFALVKKGVACKNDRIDITNTSQEIILDLNDEIRSDIYLNDGKIKLEDDSEFVGNKFLKGSGSVNLQNYQLRLGRTSNTITSTIYWDGIKGSVALNGRTYLTSAWTFSGYCMINGNGNILDLTNTGSLIIERGSTLKLKNLRINNLHGENINNLDENCTVMLEDVTCDLSGDFDFNCGKCEIYKFVDLNGSYTFFYDSNQTITVHSNTICEISKDLTWAIRTKDWSAGNKPFYFTDKTSEIRIDSSKIKVGPAGIIFSRGWMGIHGKVDLQVTYTDSDHGLKIGDGTSDGDFEILFYPASTVVAHAGSFVIDCINPTSIKSLSGFSKLHRLANNNFYVQKDFNMSNLSVYIQSPTEMIVTPGATAYYDDCKFMFDGVKFATTSSRYLDSVLLLSGNQEIFIEEGKLPLYAMVAGIGNKLHGSGSMQGKVILSGPGMELIYGLDGQMLNDIDLNYGLVKLDRDLNFARSYCFKTSGIVNLQYNDCNFGTKDNIITSTIYWSGESGSVNLNSKVWLTSQWTFSGNCTLNGNGNILDLTNSGSLIIERGSTLKLKDLHIMNMHGENINNLDENCTVILENVTCDLSNDFDFNCGKCEIYKFVDLNGSYTFFYDSNQTITVHKNTVCEISHDLTWAIRTKDSSGGNKPFYFEDCTSEVRVESSKIKIGPAGIIFTRGILGVSGLVDLQLTSTQYGYGFQIGDGTDNGNFQIVFHPGATVRAHQGAFVIDCTVPGSIKSLSDTALLYRLSNNNFYIKKDFNMSNLSVLVDSPTEMFVDDGATAYYDNCRFLFDGVKFLTTSTRYMDYVLLLSGNQEIFIEEGTFPLYAMIYGAGNKLYGSGSMSGLITFGGPGSELTYELDGKMLNDINLNGGKLILYRDLEFSGDNFIKTSGSVDLKHNDLLIGSRDFAITSTLYFSGDHGSIGLNSTLFLTSQLTFSGDCTIDGNGNILDFTRTGSLIIERGSTIKFKNLHLVNLKSENINSLDENCHVILDNVVCDLGGDFDFNCGTCEIYNYLDLNGSYTFFYDSVQTFTIHKQTVFEISKDVTLAIRTKNPSGGNRPFYFENDTSEIKFNNATIKIGSAGALFTHGTMGIEGKVYLDLNSTGSENGIIIGDGTLDGDFYIVFYPAATYVVSAGDIVINNYNSSSIVSLSDLSKLERKSNNNFYIQRDFDLANLTISLDSPTNMYVSNGINANYSNCRFVLPDYGVKFLTTSKRYLDSVLLLNGNEEVFIEEGSMPLYLTVFNTNNRLHGSGSMMGAIILGGPGSEIKLGLEGQILNNITLNYGKVTLDKDAQFSTNKFFAGSGTVDLNDKELNLGNQDLSSNSVIYWDGSYGSVSLNSRLNLSSQWTFSGYCILDGKEHILDLTTGGTLFVERGSTLVLKNINVYGIQYENIECYDDSGLIILDNCIFTLVKDFHYDRGGCHIYNYVELHGEHDLYLDTSKTMSIFNHSTFALNKNITAKLRTVNTDSDRYPVWFEDETSEFKSDNSGFELGANGAIFENGKMSLYGDVHMNMNSTDTGNGLHIGNGTYDGDFNIVFYPGSTLTAQGGNFVVDNYSSDVIKSLSLYAKLIRKSANHFYIKNNFDISNITVALDMDTTMDIVEGKNVYYDSCNFEISGVKFGATAQRYSDSVILLNGDDNICINSGILPMYVAVNGTGNCIRGSGSMNGEIILLDSDSQINLSLDGQVLKNITLNGGRCILEKDTDFGQGVQFSTTGTVQLGSSNLELGTLDTNCSCTIYFDSNQGAVDLNSMITLSGMWTFSGNCTLNGNGNILWLKPSAQINVERGSILRLLNLRIKDLSGSNIKCLDNAGTIIFMDSKTMLSGDYIFDTGKFGVNIDFEVYGTDKFIYSSPEISDIYMCSNLKFMPGTTFSYEPPIADKELIRFGGSKSKLCLNDATLHTTTTGLKLTVGMLELSGNSKIVSDATCDSEAIEFGDGINIANNFSIEPLSSAILDLSSGHFINNNVV